MQDPKQRQWLRRPGGIAERLRNLQGKTPGVEFAERAGMRTTKVSKLRLGQQLPTDEDIVSWVKAAGAPEAVAVELVTMLGEAGRFRGELDDSFAVEGVERLVAEQHRRAVAELGAVLATLALVHQRLRENRTEAALAASALVNVATTLAQAQDAAGRLSSLLEAQVLLSPTGDTTNEPGS